MTDANLYTTNLLLVVLSAVCFLQFLVLLGYGIAGSDRPMGADLANDRRRTRRARRHWRHPEFYFERLRPSLNCQFIVREDP